MKKSKYIFKFNVIVLSLCLVALLRLNVYSANDENSEEALIQFLIEGIARNQNKVKNILADFEVTPIGNEESLAFEQNEKIKVNGWLWERNKLRLTQQRLFEGEKPSTTYYYAFNGEEALYFDSTHLEKRGYGINNEPAPCGYVGTLSPSYLWFSFISYPNIIFGDMLQNKYDTITILERKILEDKIIEGNTCYVLFVKATIIHDVKNNYGDIFSLKLTIDPHYNFLFREIEYEWLGDIPEYLITVRETYHIMKTYDIEFTQVLPDFYLPKSGKLKYYMKGENGTLKTVEAHKTDITYKNVNVPVSKTDFWFPMREDLPVSNSAYMIRGKNLEDYQQKLDEAKKRGAPEKREYLLRSADGGCE